MGGTMANGGVCPTNQDKIFNSETIRNTLSLMYSCGMYNYSGQFAFEVLFEIVIRIALTTIRKKCVCVIFYA